MATVPSAADAPTALPGEGPATEVVVPVEGGTEELVVHQWAAALATALGVGLRAVHVATGPEEPPPDLFAYLSALCADHGVTFQPTVVHGPDPIEELVDELGPTALVVIGSRRLGTDFHLTSVAEALVRRAPCPVQVLRLR